MASKILTFFSVFIFAFMSSCVSTSLSSTQDTTAETKAKMLTEKMKEELSLSSIQAEKVMMLNLVNYRIIQKLRETNETQKIESTQEKYKAELRNVLTVSQYQKFLSNFSGLF